MANSRTKKPVDRTPSFLIGGGEMGALMRGRDWSKTPVGQIDTWPETLRVAVGMVLNATIPMFIWWGKDELTNFYNDAYKVILGNKHPAALGTSAKQAWSEIWKDLEPLTAQVFDTGTPVYMKDLKLLINRDGSEEDAYFTFSYSPLRDESGVVAGLFCAVTETTDEVSSRQRLEESEERFRTIADTAPTYIAMADETGSAVYFNEPWLAFTGKTMKDMEGMGWLSTLHPEDAPKFEHDFKRAFTKRIPIRKEYRFRRADGEYRWMLAIGAPRFTPDGHFSGYFGTYTDFHDLKHAQLGLEHSEERFRTLIEKSADAVQMVSAEGTILYTSESIRNVLGYSPQELLKNGVSPYLHPDDKEYFFSEFTDLVRNPGMQKTLQYRVKHKNGEWAWLETIAVNHLETPTINALVGNFRNITKQKEAEDMLTGSEARFRALAENIPNLAWMADPTGYIYWYNNRWFEYTGTKPVDMEGWGWQSVHDPEYLPKVVEKWKHSITSAQPFEMVFPIKGADGKYRPFLTRVVPIFDKNSNVIQWVGSNTDISEQMKVKRTEKRNEELEEITRQLAEQRKSLISLNKMKDEFIGMASHQLRTPATAVKQYISLVMDEMFGPLSPDQTQYLQIAYDSNERELAIINDLLKTAQMDSTEFKLNQTRYDVMELLAECIGELAPMFGMRRQTVVFARPTRPIEVRVDVTEMKLVFVNLLENASKYSYPGGTVTVSYKVLKNRLEIGFVDTGVGIAPDDQARVFEKFTRVDNELSDTVTGTGLGLYWVRQLVNLHGGTVELRSTLGKGSRFTVKLPL